MRLNDEDAIRIAASIIRQALKDRKRTQDRLEKNMQNKILINEEFLEGKLSFLQYETEIEKNNNQRKLLLGTKRELERFFNGEWFTLLSLGMDSEYLFKVAEEGLGIDR